MTFNERLDASQHVAGVEAAIWCETIRSFDDLQFLLDDTIEKAESLETTLQEEEKAIASFHKDGTEE